MLEVRFSGDSEKEIFVFPIVSLRIPSEHE